MKNSYYILLFSVLVLCSHAKDTLISKIKVRKISNDSIGIWIPPMMKAQDTVITYSNLKNAETLVIQINSNKASITASMISFDIQVNNGPKKTIKGNRFDFKKLTQLISGGKIKISNCLITYSTQSGNQVLIVLPDKRITVLP